MSNIEFEGTKQQMSELKKCIKAHKGEKGALMPVLHEAQNIYGYLPSEVQTVIADELNIPLAEVYGVATFYSQFSLQPKGKHKISLEFRPENENMNLKTNHAAIDRVIVKKLK